MAPQKSFWAAKSASNGLLFSIVPTTAFMSAIMVALCHVMSFHSAGHAVTSRVLCAGIPLLIPSTSWCRVCACACFRVLVPFLQLAPYAIFVASAIAWCVEL